MLDLHQSVSCLFHSHELILVSCAYFRPLLSTCDAQCGYQLVLQRTPDTALVEPIRRDQGRGVQKV